MNHYPRNGQLRDPNFTRHKLYHSNQYQYLQHSILWVVLNISAIVLTTRLTKVQLQNPIKQVGLLMHSKTSLVRNSDKMKYKMQKLCNENPSLKSTDLLQTQRFIESRSISTVLVPYSLRFSQVYQHYNNNIISKLYCTYRNHVSILKKKKKRIKNNKTKKPQQNKKTQQEHIITSVYITSADAIRQLL